MKKGLVVILTLFWITVLLGSYQTNCTGGGDLPHRPVCSYLDTADEGWYWQDSNERIKLENCSAMSMPICKAIGSRSEGWYSDNGLIAYDRYCHTLIGISLWGEPCEKDENEFECYKGLNLYCSEAEICLDGGECSTDHVEDCDNLDNLWSHDQCVGYASCDGVNSEIGACFWHCGN